MFQMDRIADTEKIALLVPSELVKSVKITLEKFEFLDRNRKIASSLETSYHIIPTKFKSLVDTRAFVQELGPEFDEISIVIKGSLGDEIRESNPLKAAIMAWLRSLPTNSASLHVPAKEIPVSYTVYHPMVLLPPNTFSSIRWTTIASAITKEDFTRVYSLIARALSVTHIAINAPIPPSLSNGAEYSKNENILRSPTHLQPLYGDFGPEAPIPTPTINDFESAFWVSSQQNGITQKWAPRHTMFSRGNITEKTRLLGLPSVKEAVSLSGGCTAVDLYAGIGYFAFSYAKSGVALVLGFELNPWSVEGLRRGAEANGWDVIVFKANNEGTSAEEFPSRTPKLAVYEVDNKQATSIVRNMMNNIPPIRHVNCGLLPTSRGSWNTAIQLIDKKLGGWIHLHENFRTEEIEKFAQEVLMHIHYLYISRFNDASADIQVKLEHVERVKTYAPGIMHCVLDIYIPSYS
jgi:tRNA wybutosine-synthesizing protein 2